MQVIPLSADQSSLYSTLESWYSNLESQVPSSTRVESFATDVLSHIESFLTHSSRVIDSRVPKTTSFRLLENVAC